MIKTTSNPLEMTHIRKESGNRTARIVDETIDSRELLGGAGKVVIKHESTQYELRLTRQGKLILTK